MELINKKYIPNLFQISKIQARRVRESDREEQTQKFSDHSTGKRLKSKLINDRIIIKQSKTIISYAKIKPAAKN
jgi:hypothetical protein